MSRETMIWFEPEKCTQCHGCEVACRSWRGLVEGVFHRRVLNVWRGDYPEVTNHSVSIGCLHCVDPACALVCPVQAITKRESDGDHKLVRFFDIPAKIFHAMRILRNRIKRST